MRLPQTTRSTRSALGAVAAGRPAAGAPPPRHPPWGRRASRDGHRRRPRARRPAWPPTRRPPATSGCESALTARATTDPVRHVVQRRGGRRRIQHHGVAQEQRHDRDAGVDQQAGHGIQRPDPLRPGQAVDDPGAQRARPRTASSCSGSGDPSLSSANLDAMAKTTAACPPGEEGDHGAGVRRRRRLPDPDAGLRVEGELRARLDRARARPGARPAQQLRHQRRGRPLLPRPAQGLRRDGRRLLRPRQRRRRLRRSSRAPPAPPCRRWSARCCSTATTRSPRRCTSWSAGSCGYGAIVERRPHRPGQAARRAGR